VFPVVRFFLEDGELVRYQLSLSYDDDRQRKILGFFTGTDAIPHTKKLHHAEKHIKAPTLYIAPSTCSNVIASGSRYGLFVRGPVKVGAILTTNFGRLLEEETVASVNQKSTHKLPHILSHHRTTHQPIPTYIHTYTHTHTHTHTQTQTHTHKKKRKKKPACTHTYTQKKANKHAYAHTHPHTHKRTVQCAIGCKPGGIMVLYLASYSVTANGSVYS